jgi:hypothetical protein
MPAMDNPKADVHFRVHDVAESGSAFAALTPIISADANSAEVKQRFIVMPDLSEGLRRCPWNDVGHRWF